MAQNQQPGFFNPSSSSPPPPPNPNTIPYPPPSSAASYPPPSLTNPYSYPPPSPLYHISPPPFHPPSNLHHHRSVPYPTPPLQPPSPNPNFNPNPNPNHGARLMELLSTPPPTEPSVPIANSIQSTNPMVTSSGLHSGSGPLRMSSSKIPKGRYLTGDCLVYDIDVRVPGEVQPQLEVTPITKYGSDPGLVFGRQIAVNKSYICYGLKLGAIRVLNINTALRSLLKGLGQRVTDMAFFAEDVHLLASASMDGRVYVWKIMESKDEEDKPQITGNIVVAIQVVGEGESVHPRVCWHCHKQEVLVVGVGKRVLRIDTTKVGRGEVYSSEEPLICSVDKLINGVQLVGSHDGEVTDLSMCQWMTTRLVSASVDGTEALKSSIEASVIPAFEMSCKAMFDQVDATFQKGMIEHTTTAQQQIESAHSPLAIALRDAINSASSVTQTLSGELAESQRKLVALALAGTNREPVNPLITQISNGPIGSFHEKIEAPVDPTKELSRLVYEHKYEEAFTAALQRSDVRIVSWLCSQVDLQGLLARNPLPLSQGVLLSLLQQLACDIVNDTSKKLAWMMDVVVAIKPSDALIAMHVRPIFDQVYSILNHQVTVPTTSVSELSSIRVVMRLINSTLRTL
ncbi:hypothetical protein M8C21_013713 [Ambrosia artemisiifolia]|uniref:Enhancer of mRNA-decapping protein 4-like protein n=1 Tax=Ambrosia artemisiifolia TaxID=4212 RepID=A0AAD5GWI9_AMBAR|nr:hypothetical protein M8C21_013713 [Ambrosia artemisiifolia]